jgi:uncharacterized protein (DUF2345 family)
MAPLINVSRIVVPICSVQTKGVGVGKRVGVAVGVGIGVWVASGVKVNVGLMVVTSEGDVDTSEPADVVAFEASTYSPTL